MDDLTEKLAAYRKTVDQVIADGPFDATWDSLTGFETPEWYENGKFGIFIHWGPFSVPKRSHGWYSNGMYTVGSEVWKNHQEDYGPDFGYKDFLPLFTMEKFNADEWAALFRKAGAQFVVPVGEHHDGYQMYESELSRWNAKEIGPRRDVTAELAEAVRKQWMVFGISSHRAEHWWFLNGGMNGKTDVKSGQWADFYGPAMDRSLPPNEQFLEDWLIRTCEMIDLFQPQLLWFDWWIEEEAFEPYRREMAAYYYNRAEEWNRQVAINFKYDAFPPGTAVFDIERGQEAGIREEFWQNDTAIRKNHWQYSSDETDFKEPGDLIGDLVDIVSKNGALLLNVGPKADGTIAEKDKAMLLAIGEWLRVNGEAIYGTRPWHDFGEGPTQVSEGALTDTKREPFTAQDIRFTFRDGGPDHGELRERPASVYATFLAIPTERTATITKLAEGAEGVRSSIGKVTLLGAGEVEWTRDGAGLHLTLPDTLPSEHAMSFKLEFV